ncbi:hypothetical protein GIB67_020867 [Kingdonia uniflora]|uniref:DUF7734 domain-containing protein n=1 Tax=Kingdonia uniflora TaxID=39325 RepID=A0A7J7M7N3_9MAGN|nr:hypothetical protein GIB67_020867 [Kingdonia uniflora]
MTFELRNILVIETQNSYKRIVGLTLQGFSSFLSYKTLAYPTRSVLPSRVVIASIDRIKGPFDPIKNEYIEKYLIWEICRSRL